MEKPPQEAEDGVAAIFRPSGASRSRGFHTAYAVGYYLSLYEL
jgi:hypothetical protein